MPDLTFAKAFYGQTLGIEVAETPERGLELDLADGNTVFVYPKPDFIPAIYRRRPATERE